MSARADGTDLEVDIAYLPAAGRIRTPPSSRHGRVKNRSGSDPPDSSARSDDGDVGRHLPAGACCSASAAGTCRAEGCACRAAPPASPAGRAVHTPRSISSFLIIQRRNRFSRLQALPADGRGKEVADARRASAPCRRPCADRARARGSRSCRAPDRCRHRARQIALEEESLERCRAVSSIWRRTQSSATRSMPRVQRCTIARSSGCGAAGSKPRTNARRMRAHDREQRRDRVDDAADAPEREGRRAEAGDLPIRRIGERAHQVDRIGRRLLPVVVGVERSSRSASESAVLYSGGSRTAPDSVPVTRQNRVIASPAWHIGHAAAG